jgi:hypothetical protein
VSNVIAGIDTNSIGDLKPGQWQIRMVEDYRSPGAPVPHFFFGCLNGKGLCGVPLVPSPPNKLGFVWTWDGDNTLSPSIHCTTEHGGCGFHGFMTCGVLA